MTIRKALPAVLWLTCALLPAAAAQTQTREEVSPLPPPVTRGLYRSHWFAFLNAHLEDDSRTAGAELTEIDKAARAVGVKRLSDFSRTAVYEGRLAETLGKWDRASRAYDAALRLDETSYDAAASKIEFFVRRRDFVEAAKLVPSAVADLFATREPRLATLSTLGLCLAFAAGTATFALIVILLLRYAARVAHDARELVGPRLGFSGAAPFCLILFLLPLALGLGPAWLLFWWSVLLLPYTTKKEQRFVLVGLGLFGFLPPLVATIARENILRRSPLYIAAVDLDERREDASAEDGLRQASAVFAEDSDVWFLLGIYAERSGDGERAIQNYDRAIQASPNDYRPYLNRGNVHFLEGDFTRAIGDYNTASQKAAGSPDVYYNLSIAKGESYDFDGQTAALARARELSARDVEKWTRYPTLSRVQPAAYPVWRARQRVEEWNAQEKSKRLPGHASPMPPWKLLLSPFTLGPWVAALLALGAVRLRARRPVSTECLRCGKAFCRRCRRAADPPLYCPDCVRLHIKKEPVGIEAHVAQAGEIRKRTRLRERLCRLGSLLMPGTHNAFNDETGKAVVRLSACAFAVALVVIGETYFTPRQLPPEGEWRGTAVVGAFSAFLIWALANLTAWRGSHGS